MRVRRGISTAKAVHYVNSKLQSLWSHNNNYCSFLFPNYQLYYFDYNVYKFYRIKTIEIYTLAKQSIPILYKCKSKYKFIRSFKIRFFTNKSSDNSNTHTDILNM